VQFPSGKLQSYLIEDHDVRMLANELLAIAIQHRAGCDKAAQIFNKMGIRQPGNGRTWKSKIVWRWLMAAKHGFPLPNGTRTPAAIPPDGVIVRLQKVMSDC
jgi:hypothetical protein